MWWYIIISQSVMLKMGFCLQCHGHSNWVWVHTMKSWLFLICILICWFFGNQLSSTVHVHKLECLVKRLLWSKHKVNATVNVCPDDVSDHSNLVWCCIIISQSIIQKYNFAMFKVRATNVSTRSSEILKLLQSILVWWYIITRQGKTL